jgi:hypothetical protein
MALPWDKREFRSWREALEKGALDAGQLRVLEEMVDTAQAATIEAAASMLDWQESVVDPDEHMYGV